MGQDPTMKNLTLTLSDGSLITLDNVPGNLALSVETIGIDGTTDLVASIIRQLADKLQQEGKLTPEQANQLSNLSNAGHDLGLIQQMIEDRKKSCHSDLTCLVTSKFIWHGKEYHYQNMSTMMSANGVSAKVDQAMRSLKVDGKADILVDASSPDFREIPMFESIDARSMGSAMKNLGDMYLEAKRSGALNDPAVKSLVIQLTSQIAQLSWIESAHGSFLAEKFEAGENVPTELPNEIVTSELSHAKSANICNTSAHNSDSGIQCN